MVQGSRDPCGLGEALAGIRVEIGSVALHGELAVVCCVKVDGVLRDLVFPQTLGAHVVVYKMSIPFVKDRLVAVVDPEVKQQLVFRDEQAKRVVFVQKLS